jgi:hypothetical protein
MCYAHLELAAPPEYDGGEFKTRAEWDVDMRCRSSSSPARTNIDFPDLWDLPTSRVSQAGASSDPTNTSLPIPAANDWAGLVHYTHFSPLPLQTPLDSSIACYRTRVVPSFTAPAAYPPPARVTTPANPSPRTSPPPVKSSYLTVLRIDRQDIDWRVLSDGNIEYLSAHPHPPPGLMHPIVRQGLADQEAWEIQLTELCRHLYGDVFVDQTLDDLLAEGEPRSQDELAGPMHSGNADGNADGNASGNRSAGKTVDTLSGPFSCLCIACENDEDDDDDNEDVDDDDNGGCDEEDVDDDDEHGFDIWTDQAQTMARESSRYRIERANKYTGPRNPPVQARMRFWRRRGKPSTLRSSVSTDEINESMEGYENVGR